MSRPHAGWCVRGHVFVKSDQQRTPPAKRGSVTEQACHAAVGGEWLYLAARVIAWFCIMKPFQSEFCNNAHLKGHADDPCDHDVAIRFAGHVGFCHVIIFAKFSRPLRSQRRRTVVARDALDQLCARGALPGRDAHWGGKTFSRCFASVLFFWA